MSSFFRQLTVLPLLAALWIVDAEARIVADRADDHALPGSVIELPALVDAEALQSNGGPSLSQAVAQVQRQYGGRVLDAKTQRRGNRELHVIKILTRDNKVKTVRINGRRLNRGR